ncbi:MAG TPA: A/G-specific adenine glycosylase [Pedobacter sp.]|nr:A/G-specific adenine glycosylase [Pedobacter sp.]
MSFQNEIVKWYLDNKRDLPWRDTTDPYVIWLSEIILQQTRVEQGLPYFNRFLGQYPTVSDFASASETQILKLWQGLGYYSRGRNMLFTARQIQDKHSGVFPVTYKELIALKGIGDYTAAAISSFAADEQRPVIDGNVFRLLSRYFGISTPINSTTGRKEFSELAQTLISGQTPSLYNQAIMEFGALQCKPKSPVCAVCPLQKGCLAYDKNMVSILPVKENKLRKRNRFFSYFFCQNHDGQTLVKKRTAGDIWQELYDFPLIETSGDYTADPSEFTELVTQKFGEHCRITPLTHKKHLLTHQTIYVQFFALDNYIINFNQNAEIKWVSQAELEELPLPKVISDFTETYSIN